MFKRTSNTSQRFFAAIGAAALVALSATPAQAQQFQQVYGNGITLGCGTSGHNGVQRCAFGGYIAVGSTRDSGSTSCITTGMDDIYVVRTNSMGTPSWIKRIDLASTSSPAISFLDSATCVRETHNYEFIIAGFAMVTHPSGITSRDIFLIRLDINGNVVWAKTYGDDELDERAFDVIETTTGPVNAAVSKWDIVVAGYQQHPSPGSPARALLYRFDSNGNPIWQNTYRPGSDADERFHALAECTNGVPADSLGDIVAVGQTNAYGPTTDAFVVRVNSTTGGFAGGFQGVAAINGGGQESFHAVQELTLGTRAGDIVAAGVTTSRSAPSTSAEAFVVETQANPSLPLVANRVFGDNGSQLDIAYGLKQITAAGLNTGNIVVTGMATLPSGFGGGDSFLQELSPGLLGMVGSIAIHGSPDPSEVTYSVSDVAAMGTIPATTAGFILCGRTGGFSFSPGAHKLWLIKTDASRLSYCQSAPLSVSHTSIPLTTSTTPPSYESKETIWVVGSRVYTEFTYETLCYNLKGTRQENPNNGSDGVSSVEPEGIAEVSAAHVAPNPVRAGDRFTLGFTARTAGIADVVVSDVKGSVVAHISSKHEAGDAGVTIGTEGWGAGTYFVRIETGGGVATSRVVILE